MITEVLEQQDKFDDELAEPVFRIQQDVPATDVIAKLQRTAAKEMGNEEQPIVVALALIGEMSKLDLLSENGKRLLTYWLAKYELALQEFLSTDRS